MAVKRIDPALVPIVCEEIATLFPSVPGFFEGAHPHPRSPLLSDDLGPNEAAREAFRRRLEAFQRSGHPVLDVFWRGHGFTEEYTAGLLSGWSGEIIAAEEFDPDFVIGHEDGTASLELCRGLPGFEP